MKKILSIIFAIILGVTALSAMPGKTDKLVNDFANILTVDQENTLTKRLEALSDSTTNQVCIVTVSNLEGKAIAEYAQELGQSWGVGDKRFDNGVIILVKPKTASSKGQVFIATGYGVEGVLPDAICKRIIENKIIPQFKKNDYYTGIYDAVVSIENRLEKHDVEDNEGLGFGLIVFVFFTFLFLLFLFTSDETNSGGSSSNHSGGSWMYDSGSSHSSHHSSGSSSSGSSSFGGFGGGSFGGGGAGGSW